MPERSWQQQLWKAGKMFQLPDDHMTISRDCPVWMKEKHIQQIKAEKWLIYQEARTIHRWSVLNGFKFSQTKTVCTHSCMLHSVHAYPDPDPINVAEETKLLGLILLHCLRPLIIFIYDDFINQSLVWPVCFDKMSDLFASCVFALFSCDWPLSCIPGLIALIKLLIISSASLSVSMLAVFFHRV